MSAVVTELSIKQLREAADAWHEHDIHWHGRTGVVVSAHERIVELIDEIERLRNELDNKAWLSAGTVRGVCRASDSAGGSSDAGEADQVG
jgi:ApbE superfamily uncharacterized protein (UPF0280 family)